MQILFIDVVHAVVHLQAHFSIPEEPVRAMKTSREQRPKTHRPRFPSLDQNPLVTLTSLAKRLALNKKLGVPV